MSDRADPNVLTDTLEIAVDAFNEEGRGIPTDEGWCLYLLARLVEP